jgi:hypothetical protein
MCMYVFTSCGIFLGPVLRKYCLTSKLCVHVCSEASYLKIRDLEYDCSVRTALLAEYFHEVVPSVLLLDDAVIGGL